jgi:hypothetical protein
MKHIKSFICVAILATSLLSGCVVYTPAPAVVWVPQATVLVDGEWVLVPGHWSSDRYYGPGGTFWIGVGVHGHRR